MEDEDETLEKKPLFGLGEYIREIRRDLNSIREQMAITAKATDIVSISVKLEEMVSRREFERYASSTEKEIDRFDGLTKELATKEDVERLEKAVKERFQSIERRVNSGPIPSWLWTAIASIAAALLVVVDYFHKI